MDNMLLVLAKDLDLVDNIAVGGAGISDFTCNEEGTEIVLTVPELAVEGDVLLIMVNRKEVTVPFTLVKPTYTAYGSNPVSAGSDLYITGKDLDLVAAVTFGGDIQVEVEATETLITVAVPTAAETGKVVLNLKNGTDVEFPELTIDKPAGAFIAVMPETVYSPGEMFIIDIENPDHLTGVQVDGEDVNYILNNATLYFQIPLSANANSLRTLNGGWSYTWQGSADDFVPQYNTIYEALFDRFPGKVSWVPGVVYDKYDWQRDFAINIPQAVRVARTVDVIVCCVGENSYCETPGNMDDLNLSANQKELVRELAATGKPVVLVLNEGRPRLIGDIEPLASAVVDIMLPSNYGGDALAALLAGDENFSGKLPFTYSKHINALHTYDYKVSEHRTTMDGSYNYDAIMDVQWPFGHGLSYTSYAYSNLKVSADSFAAGDVLKVSVDVTNTGSRAGKEAVLLYSSDLVASLIPDVKRLRAFEKVALEPGETKTVSFELPASDLAFVGTDGRWRLEAGDFRLSCGGEGVMVKCTQTKVWDTPNI